MDFIFDRLKDKNPDGSLQIMYTIHGQSSCRYSTGVCQISIVSIGEKIFPELELTHLDGHKGSKPVRYVVFFGNARTVLIMTTIELATVP